MAQDTPTDELLRTIGKEAMKIHRQYDGSDRLSIQHETVQNAIHGAPALRTDYTYAGASERVVGMKETLGTWDSAWDI